MKKCVAHMEFSDDTADMSEEMLFDKHMRILKKPEAAEINLLGAESIIGNAVGTDNDYMRTTYRYLNNLYARWKKPEKAIEYRDKFLGVNRGISRTKSSRRR